MCVQCMYGTMAAGAGATGVRSWLAVRGFAWLTAKRMRRVTIGLLGGATLASSLLVSGSTDRDPARAAGPAHPVTAAPAQRVPAASATLDRRP